MFILQKNYFWWKNISWMLFFSLLLLISSQIIKYEFYKLQIDKSLYLTKTFWIEIVVENNSTFLFGMVQQPTLRMQVAIMFVQVITICIIVGLIWYFKNCFLTFIFLIILVGALGNFINRLWNNGKIIDYLKITVEQSYINFNLEDFLMGLGAILLLIKKIFNFFWWIKKKN